ncbi:MAG: PAS domain S-box protein [Burkholderiales bacterium]|nr:PAS domain S-box protein [Burkholderiales bacterium]MDE2431531.1 PAS domain S-box protein [Burkholderiales bacterium]
MNTAAIRSSPELDGSVSSLTDLVQQVQRLNRQVEACSLMAQVAQNADNAVVVTNSHGEIEWVNDSFTRISGYTLAELMGKKPSELLQSIETDPAVIAYMREQIALQLPFQAEVLNRAKNGHLYWVRIEAKPLRNELGEVHRYMAVQRDVTSRRQTDSRLALHHAVIQALSEASDVGGFLPTVMKMIGSFIDWPIGVAWEVKSKRWVGDQNLRCSALWSANELRYAGYLAASETLVWRKSEGWLGHIWQTRKTTFVQDLRTVDDPGRGAVAEKESVRSVFVLPILSGEKVTYLLEFAGPTAQPLDADLIQLLEGIALQVSHFIDRKRDELRVRQFMTEFDSLFKLSPDGFVVFNAEGIRSYGNPAFYAMTGLPRERLDGVTESEFDVILSSLCSPESRPKSIAEVAASGEGDRLQLVLPRPGVLQRSVRDMYDTWGRFIGRAIYLRDITHEIEVDRMKSEFLSTAAHELRTPMASVHGFTELLLKRNFSEEKRRDVYETIYRQSTLLVNMVTELLDLARIESRAGKDFNIRPLNVLPVIESAVHGLLFPGDKRRVELLLPESVPMVFADDEHLVRALTNILSNAYKYSPKGGRIVLDVVERGLDMGPQVGIRVADEGIGMSPDQLARVCERFYRADPSGNIPGTGLGMSLVKEIMTILGGEVEVHSEAGKGTEVTLWLRVVHQDQFASVR